MYSPIGPVDNHAPVSGPPVAAPLPMVELGHNLEESTNAAPPSAANSEICFKRLPASSRDCTVLPAACAVHISDSF